MRCLGLTLATCVDVAFCFQVSRACLLPEDEWGDGTTLGPGNVCLQFNFFVTSCSEVCLTASSTVRGVIVKRQSNKQISLRCCRPCTVRAVGFWVRILLGV